MLLYICSKCHQQKRKLEIWGLWTVIRDRSHKRPLLLECPHGCGAMTLISPDEKLMRAEPEEGKA